MRKIRGTQPSELLLDLLLVLFEGARGSGELAEAVGLLRRRDVPVATFYRHLQRAVDLGWVEMTTTEASVQRSGPGRPERLYRITEQGGQVLRAGMEQQRRRVARAGALGLLTEEGR
ncbi:MAG: hypothetical protein AAF657_04725 [Acidobacteriota bacterium]